VDSLFVIVSDTVKTVAVEEWWKNPSWFAALAACFSIIISILVVVFNRKFQKKDDNKRINTYWMDLTKSRLIFWEAIENGYEIWKQETGFSNYSTIDEFIWETRLPLYLGIDINENPESFREKLIERIGEKKGDNQKMLLQFCDRIFCSHGHNLSIFPNNSEPGFQHGFNEFYRECSKLTNALNGWADTESIKYLGRRFRGDYTLITLLVWLEISLIKRLGRRWSDRSPLFKLAIEIQKNIFSK